MTSGRYITSFPDNEERVLRSFLYKLENLNIVKLVREKEGKLHKHKWELTKKGIGLIENNEELQTLWEEGKVIEFYNFIKNLL